MRVRIHGTLFCGGFLNFWSFSVNAFFPMATSSFSSGSSEGGLERRRFFVLPGARAESLSSNSCTEIFRLIRCNGTQSYVIYVNGIARTYFLGLLLLIREHIDVDSITARRRASCAVTLSIGGPGERRAHDGGRAGFTKVWGMCQWRGRGGSIRG